MTDDKTQAQATALDAYERASLDYLTDTSDGAKNALDTAYNAFIVAFGVKPSEYYKRLNDEVKNDVKTLLQDLDTMHEEITELANGVIGIWQRELRADKEY